jgi:hypothetical protein
MRCDVDRDVEADGRAAARLCLALTEKTDQVAFVDEVVNGK